MGEVVELKTKKVVRATGYHSWEGMYDRIRKDWERELDESHRWYTKYAKLNLDVHNMSLWDRIFNWKY